MTPTHVYTPFILVFRPHQRPAWADWFRDEQDVIDSLLNRYYATRCNAEWSEDRQPSYDEAIEELEHDLHGITRLNSADELRRYVSDRDWHGPHNKGVDAAVRAGRSLGWIDGDDD